jgi:hypothetical protein
MDYKKYSLENLEKWVIDAVTTGEATPREIYDTIYDVVCEEYYHHKHHTSRCYDLMLLLNGNGNHIRDDSVLSCDKDDKSPECQQAWNDFWEDSGSSKESSQYTEEELNAMCDKAASDDEKNKCREYNLREAEYYNKRAELDSKWKSVSVPSQPLYVSEDGDVWIPDTATKEDKVVKWQLPVEVDGLTGECIVQFPDDLLEAANLKEGDTVEWIDRGDGSFELRKVKNVK